MRGFNAMHHQLNGHEFEQTQGDSEGQGSLVCCSPWDHKEPDITYRLRNTRLSLAQLDLWFQCNQVEIKVSAELPSFLEALGMTLILNLMLLPVSCRCRAEVPVFSLAVTWGVVLSS